MTARNKTSYPSSPYEGCVTAERSLNASLLSFCLGILQILRRQYENFISLILSSTYVGINQQRKSVPKDARLLLFRFVWYY